MIASRATRENDNNIVFVKCPETVTYAGGGREGDESTSTFVGAWRRETRVLITCCKREHQLRDHGFAIGEHDFFFRYHHGQLDDAQNAEYG